jgi:hypothetical protein
LNNQVFPKNLLKGLSIFIFSSFLWQKKHCANETVTAPRQHTEFQWVTQKCWIMKSHNSNCNSPVLPVAAQKHQSNYLLDLVYN